MSLIAAHINDAALSVLTADRLLYREPGFALLDDDKLITGDAAYAAARLKPRRIQNRHWSELVVEPLDAHRFRHLSAADLVSQQLEHIWRQVGGKDDQLLIAVPAYMTNAHLGLLLGILQELHITVGAMVDAAVAATRRHYVGAVPVHVDLSLHTTTLTRLAQGGLAQVERSEVIADAGLLVLYDVWIRIIAEAFVRQSRFDPLHTAETEQLLQDRLGDWLAIASAEDTVQLEIEFRGAQHKAVVETLDLVAAAAPIYQRIVSSLRAQYRADEWPAIQLTDRAARMPGLANMLTARVGGEVYLLESGATARGLLARGRELHDNGGAVTLRRQLPWDQSPVEVQALQRSTAEGLPTHLLYANTAYRIDENLLLLGSQTASDERSVDLAGDMPGVSRRHCGVHLQNGKCVLNDYSRYGTFLNGHRIDGSAVLQIGDLIRIGTPGHELRLIATERRNGT